MVDGVSGARRPLATGSAAETAAAAKSARRSQAPRADGAPPLDGASPLPEMTPPDAASGGEALSSLRSLPQIGFSMTQLIKLVLELANQMHKTEREESMKEADAALKLGEDAAEDIRASATDTLIGGAIGASLKIVGAGITLGGAAKMADVSDTQTVMNKMMGYQAAGQIAGSSGDFGDSTMKAEGQEAQADREVHESQGQRLKSVEDSERQDAQDEQQLIQSIIQTLEKQEESRHEAVRATA